MKTHEASITKQGQVDFCWEDGYRPMVDSYSVTYPNGSPYQAWRAGFREGVKMSLIDGIKVAETTKELHWHNLHRLKIWCSIGSHVDNGLWAILGARQGAYMTMLTDWNWIEVRDFDALGELWKSVKSLNVVDEIEKYGSMLNNELGVNLELISPSASEFIVETFKDQFQQIRQQLRWTMGRNDAL
jgi:hypothetical protein